MGRIRKTGPPHFFLTHGWTYSAPVRLACGGDATAINPKSVAIRRRGAISAITRTNLETDPTDKSLLFATIERWRPWIFGGFVKSP